MSERTIQQLVARLNYSDPDFDDCTDAAIILLRQHAEIERLTANRETIIPNFLKRTGQYVTNDASREAAIASAVLAERTAIAAQLREWADELGFEGSSWRWKTPGGLLYRAAEMISDRSKP